jgi:UPF0755 protein
MKTKNKLFKFIVAIIFLFILFAFYSLIKLNSTLPIENDITVYIPQKVTVNKALEILNKNHICTPNWFFKITCKIYSKFSDRTIVAGSYRFKKETTNIQVLYSIFSGKQLYAIKVTFPEGITIRKFASILKQKIGLDSAKFVKLLHSDSLLSANDIPARTAEGYLMPETYEFFPEQPIGEIIDRLITAQNVLWQKKFAKTASEEVRTKHEILTMASIIEAETPAPEEKARISGVYYNRLNRGIPLQSDPTVQYAMGEKKRVLFRYLEFDNPYNTYKYIGLPPGPINSPSISSIEAALEPENNDFLYFVAIGDGSGRHNFSRTLSQHQYFVSQYRKNASKNH